MAIAFNAAACGLPGRRAPVNWTFSSILSEYIIIGTFPIGSSAFGCCKDPPDVEVDVNWGLSHKKKLTIAPLGDRAPPCSGRQLSVGGVKYQAADIGCTASAASVAKLGGGGQDRRQMDPTLVVGRVAARWGDAGREVPGW